MVNSVDNYAESLFEVANSLRKLQENELWPWRGMVWWWWCGGGVRGLPDHLAAAFPGPFSFGCGMALITRDPATAERGKEGVTYPQASGAPSGSGLWPPGSASPQVQFLATFYKNIVLIVRYNNFSVSKIVEILGCLCVYSGFGQNGEKMVELGLEAKMN